MIKWINYYLCVFSCLIMISATKVQGYEKIEEEISHLELIISSDQIKPKIIQIAKQIDIDYIGKEVVIIMVMKGAFILTSDLVREMKTPFTIEAVSCSSYRGTKKRSNLVVKSLEDLDLEGKHVIIIDDIIDSGHTMKTIINEVIKKKASSVKSLALLLKKTSRRVENFQPDYFIFEIDDKFVIGYGLDYKEYFRGLRCVYVVD